MKLSRIGTTNKIGVNNQKKKRYVGTNNEERRPSKSKISYIEGKWCMAIVNNQLDKRRCIVKKELLRVSKTGSYREPLYNA